MTKALPDKERLRRKRESLRRRYLGHRNPERLSREVIEQKIRLLMARENR